MNDSEILELINTMDFIADDADGECCSSVIVEDNKLNRDILAKVGFNSEYIDKEDLIDEDSNINVAIIAFRYSNWWNGEYFENRNLKKDEILGEIDIKIQNYISRIEKRKGSNFHDETERTKSFEDEIYALEVAKEYILKLE